RYTLSLHDALPIFLPERHHLPFDDVDGDAGEAIAVAPEGFAERRQLGIHGVAGLAAGAVLARERGNGVGAARTDKAQDDDQGGGEDLRATSRFRLRTHDP